MVPRPADIYIEEAARTDALAEPARPISDILRFGPHASYGQRVKLASGASVTQFQNSAENSKTQRTRGNVFAKALAGHS